MILLSTEAGFLVGGVASLLEPADRLTAWAERHIRDDPDLRWLLGNYVEADRANDNGHIFPLEELRDAQHTLAGKPLNMMHREHYIVGYFAGAELVGDDDKATAAKSNAYVEALAGIWHSRFPEEMFNIRQAHKEGCLFFSMETVPEEVSCPTCAHRAVFAGYESEGYCEHMQGATAPKRLHRPHFAGGAIIIPPVKPGWSRADITAISKAMEDSNVSVDKIYAQVAEEAPYLEPEQWETMMAHIVTLAARDFSTEQRRKMADKGTAMPDGSFPIANRQDVMNAIHAIGRTSPGKRAAVKAHIKKRARALNCEDLIPEDW